MTTTAKKKAAVIYEDTPKAWSHRLKKYIERETGLERRNWRYGLAIRMEMDEVTVRGRLKKANGGNPIPPPRYGNGSTPQNRLPWYQAVTRAKQQRRREKEIVTMPETCGPKV